MALMFAYVTVAKICCSLSIQLSSQPEIASGASQDCAKAREQHLIAHVSTNYLSLRVTSVRYNFNKLRVSLPKSGLQFVG